MTAGMVKKVLVCRLFLIGGTGTSKTIPVYRHTVKQIMRAAGMLFQKRSGMRHNDHAAQ